MNLIILGIISVLSLYAEPPNPQSLLEKWDRETSLQDGTYKMKIVGESPVRAETDLFLFSLDKSKRLYQFIDYHGDIVSKLLVDGTTTTMHSSNINKSEIFKFSIQDAVQMDVLDTSFSFFDLGGFSLEKNYKVDKMEEYKAKDAIYYKIEASPLLLGSYKKLSLYFDKTTLNPYRIDFYNDSGSLVKILRVKYGKIPVETAGKKEEKSLISEYEMTRMQNSEKSKVLFLNLRTYPLINSSLFQIKNLNFSK